MRTTSNKTMSEKTTRQLPGEVFFDNLSEINEGALLNALDKKMTDLVAAVLATGNNGNLTLKLSVKRKGGMNQVVIEPKVSANIPDPTISARIMFADADGNLHTDDPNQGMLDLDAPKKVIKPKVVDFQSESVESTPAKVKQA